MLYVVAVPEMLASAATDLERIGSSLSAANVAAAAPTTAVVAAAGDEVSAAIASLFSSHAREFQALSAQAAVFHSQFAHALTGAGGSYAVAEAANATPMQAVLGVINAPTEALMGRPLIGNGSNGAAGTGQNGGPGGILIGNGGNGGSGTPGTATTAPGAGGCRRGRRADRPRRVRRGRRGLRWLRVRCRRR